MAPSAASSRTRRRTSRVPCGSSPLVGSSSTSSSRGRSRPAARPAAASCRASTAGTACSPPRSGRPAPGPRRPRCRGCAGGGTVGRVEPGQVVPAGQVRVERRPLDQRADPGQHRAAPSRHRHAEQLGGAAGRARPGRAACGSSWSCPTRSGRGSRRPRPRGTAQVDVVDRHLAAGTAWSAPVLMASASAVISDVRGRPRRTSTLGVDRADVDPAAGHQYRHQAGLQQPCRCPDVPDTGCGRAEQRADDLLAVAAEPAWPRRRGSGRRRSAAPVPSDERRSCCGSETT